MQGRPICHTLPVMRVKLVSVSCLVLGAPWEEFKDFTLGCSFADQKPFHAAGAE